MRAVLYLTSQAQGAQGARAARRGRLRAPPRDVRASPMRAAHPPPAPNPSPSGAPADVTTTNGPSTRYKLNFYRILSARMAHQLTRRAVAKLSDLM